MAQWQGQFSGRTHATKVRRLEKTLAPAVRIVVAFFENHPGGEKVREDVEVFARAPRSLGSAHVERRDVDCRAGA
jgi:hypothetical protein